MTSASRAPGSSGLPGMTRAAMASTVAAWCALKNVIAPRSLTIAPPRSSKGRRCTARRRTRRSRAPEQADGLPGEEQEDDGGGQAERDHEAEAEHVAGRALVAAPGADQRSQDHGRDPSDVEHEAHERVRGADAILVRGVRGER